MSITNDSFLEALPIEILYRIYDELDAETILFSMRCVSKKFYLITSNYDRYELDFCYVSRSSIPAMARLIDPKNVISLKLSDEERTNGQIELFLSYFPIEEFLRLQTLTLHYVNDEDMDKFHKCVKKYYLRKMSVSFSEYESNNAKKFLTTTLLCNTLHTLELLDGDDVITGMRWPNRSKVESIIIHGKCNWDIAYFIISHSPYLRKLVLKYVSKEESDENIIIEPDMKQCDNLTSLSLSVNSEITMDDMELFLALFPKLTYLQLSGPLYGAHSSLLNGNRWEHLIQTKLLLLNRFEFYLIHFSRVGTDCPTLETLIEPFRTSFWLENKSSIIKCDEEHNKDYKKLHLYTIPTFRNEFDYSHQRSKIVYSLSNIVDNNQPVIFNTKTLILELNEVINECYVFRNVNELTLLIKKEWLIGSIERLSKVINLLNLKTISLDFRCDPISVANLNVEIDALFTETPNLCSVRIICNDYEDMTLITRASSEEMMVITQNAIGLKLPRRIKQLDIEIKSFEDAITILEHGKHLSRITFRPIHDGENLAHKIKRWLEDMNRDYMIRLDWGYFCNCECCDSVKAIYMWLDSKYE